MSKKLKGKAKQAARKKIRMAKKAISNNPAITVDNQRPDWQAINADQGYMHLHLILGHNMDDYPKRCYDLISGNVLGMLDSLEYIHQSADKNVNTHMQQVTARDSATNKLLFKVADHFVCVRKTTRVQSRYLLENYIKDLGNDKIVLIPAIQADTINGRIEMSLETSYCCEYGAEALCLSIGMIKTPAGVEKTIIRTHVVSKAVWAAWSKMAIAIEHEDNGRMSWAAL